MAKVMALSQLVQGSLAGSTEEWLECMAGGGQMKHLILAIFWALLVMIWMVILMGVLSAPSKKVQILGKDTVYSIIALQIVRRAGPSFQSKEQVIALITW